LPEIASDPPPDRSLGTVVLAAELYVAGALPLAAVKEVFAVLLFSESHPEDHAVSFACQAFLRTGPLLDTSEVGRKMLEYVVLRLKEVLGYRADGSRNVFTEVQLSVATRKSITDVLELQSNRWEHSRKSRAGQKEARALARMFIKRVLSLALLH
jgi:hypothetical protein